MTTTQREGIPSFAPGRGEARQMNESTIGDAQETQNHKTNRQNGSRKKTNQATVKVETTGSRRLQIKVDRHRQKTVNDKGGQEHAQTWGAGRQTGKCQTNTG